MVCGVFGSRHQQASMANGLGGVAVVKHRTGYGFVDFQNVTYMAASCRPTTNTYIRCDRGIVSHSGAGLVLRFSHSSP